MTTHAHAKLSVPALGWGFSAALAVFFVIAILAALFLPMRPAYGLVTTLFGAPIDTSTIWLNVAVWSLVTGWVVASVLGTVYNFIVVRALIR
ncbi:MAG: hypothetical protein JOZ70_10665 [Pseudolabrys sp.]|nr:hypothetical protein [Pseudolabrys sp.]